MTESSLWHGDAVGRPAAWEKAFYARDTAGTVVLVGVPTPDQPLPPRPTAAGEIFVSERIGLDDIEDAFHKMHSAEVLRSVVVFK